jgi:hypothetical protein
VHSSRLWPLGQCRVHCRRQCSQCSALVSFSLSAALAHAAPVPLTPTHPNPSTHAPSYSASSPRLYHYTRIELVYQHHPSSCARLALGHTARLLPSLFSRKKGRVNIAERHAWIGPAALGVTVGTLYPTHFSHPSSSPHPPHPPLCSSHKRESSIVTIASKTSFRRKTCA